jgi:predicted RNase H-like HicB family nuclease
MRTASLAWLYKYIAAGGRVDLERAVYLKTEMSTSLKVIVEKHPDGYVAYPIGVRGVIVGQGATYEDALADVRSAIQFHIETFGGDSLMADEPVIEAFVAEAIVAV